MSLTVESGTIDYVVEVHVDYSDENTDVPNELNIALGYKETGVVPMGIYTVNEVTIQSPPKTLLIKAHATNLRLSLKEKVSKEWHQITLGNLVKKIAEKHGYGCRVAEEFENVLIPHINQIEESDISLLTKNSNRIRSNGKASWRIYTFYSKRQSQISNWKSFRNNSY